MSTQGLKHLEARSSNGMVTVFLEFLQCQGPLVCLPFTCPYHLSMYHVFSKYEALPTHTEKKVLKSISVFGCLKS
jgi:hypothetical protein